MVSFLEGNKLSVSDFLTYKDGSYITATNEQEKRGIKENVKVWHKDKCIQCTQC